MKVYLIWEYDDGIQSEKSLVFVCATQKVADKIAGKLQKGMPDYYYDVEEREVIS